MNCPVCQVPLQISERQGIEIDYCPRCRGIWLDRGELDKLIERSAAWESGRAQDDRGRREREEYRERDDDYRHGYGYRGKKRRSFLGDLFDFD